MVNFFCAVVNFLGAGVRFLCAVANFLGAVANFLGAVMRFFGAAVNFMCAVVIFLGAVIDFLYYTTNTFKFLSAVCADNGSAPVMCRAWCAAYYVLIVCGGIRNPETARDGALVFLRQKIIVE